MSATLMVKDVHPIHGTAAVTVDENALLKSVISIYATNPGIKGIFLTDAQNRFTGMVSRLAIQKWAEYELFGKWQNNEPDSLVSEMVEDVQAKSVARGDWKSFGLKPNDTLQNAFQRMIQSGEDILPVVDDDGRVIGDLLLSEILMKAIEISDNR
ncbi:MAG: CBS domain-containing protein [Dehalococcoides mccartyi]|uniref:CBS domain-containing protein n=2 Tax=Dehalococcoides mccartyi TaxID=61435 RepID=UPI0030FCD9E4